MTDRSSRDLAIVERSYFYRFSRSSWLARLDVTTNISMKVWKSFICSRVGKVTSFGSKAFIGSIMAILFHP